MKRNKVIIIITAIAFLLTCAACEAQEQPPVSSTIGGTVLEVGREINDQHEIVLADVRFEVREEFFFYFHNNMPFDTNTVVVRLVNNFNDETLAENMYEVHPDSKTLTDKIWFGSPGRYSITVQVGDQVRAVREVIIE